MIDVRTADDWALIRTLRLGALRDAPGAFTSSYDREAAFDETSWRDRARTGQWFVAFDGTDAVGVACGIDGSGDGGLRRELVGMWVAPTHRRQGVAARLLDAVAGWARSQGATTLALGVVEGNEPARLAYLTMGLVPTGEQVPVWDDPSRFVEMMEMPLGDPRVGPSPS